MLHRRMFLRLLASVAFIPGRIAHAQTQPSVVELAVNRKSAAALGLTIPQSILLRADTVFE